MLASTEIPLDLAQFFPSLELTDQAPLDPSKRKVFTGDGTQYLAVPGLKTIESITIDGVKLEEFREDEVIDEEDPSRKKMIRIPLYIFGVHNGTATIVRSVISNFGRWQKGSPVVIVGEWDEVPAETAPAADAGK